MSERLPRFVVFYSESLGKYLTYKSDQAAVKVSSPLLKFEVVPSTIELSSIVHLRSCYNNKYLKQKTIKDLKITADADKPEEHRTLWSSTLFQPEFLADGSVRLIHLYSGNYVECYAFRSVDGGQGSNMWTVSRDPNPNNVFRAIDWESLVTLPRRLAFKGDNWRYLGLGTGDVLRFEIEDEGHKSIVNEIVSLPDGTFRIKNVSLGAFWKVNAQTGFISADDKSTTPTPDSLFSAVKVNESAIALRNIGNNKLCKRYTILNQVISGLNAIETETTQYARLMLTELVASRSITDIQFHANDGWVYNETTNVILNPGQEVINDTSEIQIIEVNIPYKDVKTSKWTATVQTLKQLGPAFDIHPKEIPYVSDSREVQMSGTLFEPSYVSGEAKSKESWTVKSQKVGLKPMTKVTLKVLATSITCDVPFTYTQHDVLDEATKQVETRVMEDGVYTGTNYINVTVDVSPPEPFTQKE
ncbi:hypothetical protein LINGRAHAP2_LOCUS19237 [Linum grandiflorum]